MQPDELSSLYERFQAYMDKCTHALSEAGLDDVYRKKHQQPDYAAFCRFWQRIESIPSLKEDWLTRLSPLGFEIETALISEVLSPIQFVPLGVASATSMPISETLRSEAA